MAFGARLAISLFVAGCSACSSTVDEAPAPLEIETSFSADEQATIGATLEQWNAVAHRFDGAGWRIVKGTPPHNAAAWTFGDEQRIVVKDGLPARTFRISMLHELGHARGLDHVRNGVMQGGEGVSGPSSTEFSAEDLSECRRVRACD